MKNHYLSSKAYNKPINMFLNTSVGIDSYKLPLFFPQVANLRELGIGNKNLYLL